MEKPKSYYRNIYARFSPKKNVGYQHEQNDDRNMDVHPSFEKEDALEDELIEHYGKFIGNKCDAKELYKLHEDVIEYYVNSIGEVNAKTLRKYARIISQFMIYSPTLNPENLDKFIQLKFPNKFQISYSKLNSSITQSQYTSTLKRLLLIIYRDDINIY